MPSTDSVVTAQTGAVGRPSLRAVAELAGVSEPTVSRVLNGRVGVAERTRERVVAALAELGFSDVPNPVRVKRGVVGVISGELTNPVFPEIVHQIVRRLARQGLVATVGSVAADLTPEVRYVEEFVSSGVDGIVFVAGRHAEVGSDLQIYHQLVAAQVPFVLVNGGQTTLDVPHVWCDESLAAVRAVEHLTAMGHKSIGFVLGSRRYRATQRFIDGFERAAAANGLSVAAHDVVETAFTHEGGSAGATRLIRSGHTALVCGNDLMAIGAIHAATSLGLAVPGDVSVVGYDGTDMSAVGNPPLTTLRQPFDDMGEMIADALVSEIERSGRFRDGYVFAPELVARSSTGAAPIR